MNIIKFVLGKLNYSKEENLINQSENIHTSTYSEDASLLEPSLVANNSIWDYKIMLLRSLHKLKCNEAKILDERFKQYTGDVSPIIEEFISIGLIKKACIIDVLDANMTVQIIKERLRNLNVSTSGKKKELLEKLMNTLTEDEKANWSGEAFYIVTKPGWEVCEESNRKFKAEIKKIEDLAIEQFCKDNPATGCKIISNFFASAPFNTGINYAEGFPGRYRLTVKHLMNSNYLIDSTNLIAREAKIIRATIAAHYLLSFRQLESRDIATKIFLIKDDFRCLEIEDFLNNNPTGIFEYCNPSDQKEIIEIFYHSLTSKALHDVDLKEYNSEKDRQYLKGVTILGGKENCIICKGKENHYSWERLETIPKLPRYPGCICCYAAWLKR